MSNVIILIIGGLFGGCLNKNETFFNAIKREMKEETGLQIKDKKFFLK